MTKINLGIVMGGKSVEHEVSLQSADSIIQAVDQSKYNLWLIGIDKQGNWFLLDNSNYLLNRSNPDTIALDKTKAQPIALVPADNSNKIISIQTSQTLGALDVVFSIVHGTIGEDGGLQGFFTVLNLPFVGADILGASVGMDKDVSKRLLRDAGIGIADFVTLRQNDLFDSATITRKLGLPLFVKPAASGSSVGVSKAKTEEELTASIKKAFQYDTKVIVEEYIEGREIECAVMGNYAYKASRPGEIVVKHEFYSYDAKYLDKKGADLKIPADLPETLEEKLKNTAIESYKILECQGLARVDFFITENETLILNEINTLPGFTSISMFPKLFGISGLPYNKLIDELIQLALERQKMKLQRRSDFKT